MLETKNMNGWIFGSEQQAQWTQKLFNSSFKFQSSLRQNYKHLKTLEAALGIAPEHLRSVITFVGGNTFKTQMPANVTEGIEFIRYIKSLQTPVFSEVEVNTLLNLLNNGRHTPTFATHRVHLQHLNRRSDPAAGRTCPKCGSPQVICLVKSGSRAGQKFWGCSTIPKCRIMQSL